MQNNGTEQQSETRLQVIGTHIVSPLDSTRNSRLLFTRAEDCFLYDNTGKKYIDLINGKGSVILGHNDSDVNQAIQCFLQEKQNILTGPGEPILTLAKLIIDDSGLPDAKASFYTTGTAACRAAATAACDITGKKLILSAGYHGWDPMWQQSDELLQPNQSGVIDFYFVPELLEKALHRYANQIALVIFSPDYTYLRPETIQSILTLSRAYGVVVCCDDVKQGYRHRQGTSLELVTTEKAHLYTFSKGLANGHRISCLVGASQIMAGTKELTFTSYYDLLPVVAALETLRKMRIKEGYEYLRKIGGELVAKLRLMFRHSGLPIEVNGDSGIFQFVFGTDELECAFYQEAIIQGILLYEGDNQMLSCCFNEALLEELVKRFQRLIEKLMKKFSFSQSQEISAERTFCTAWNMIDGASDNLPYEKQIELINYCRE